MKNFKALRVDIDTIADVKAVPRLLEILKKYDVKATFFIAMGPDKSARNLFRYFRYSNNKKIEAMRRFGIKNIIRGLSPFPPEIENCDFSEILEEGHEIGLHGYDHYNWIKNFSVMDESKIKEEISKGCRIFKKIFGVEAQAFASPGFKTSPMYFKTLDSFKFKYSSDVLGHTPYYPAVSGDTAKTLQVPVTMESVGEMIAKGHSHEEILKRHKTDHGFFTFYVHPSYEVVFALDLFEKIIATQRKLITFSEIAESCE